MWCIRGWGAHEAREAGQEGGDGCEGVRRDLRGSGGAAARRELRLGLPSCAGGG